MNIRSIKRRNALRLKRSVGRGWSAAAVALPAYFDTIHKYNEWFNKVLRHAFGLPLVSPAPKPSVLDHFEDSIDAELRCSLLRLEALGISREHL